MAAKKKNPNLIVCGECGHETSGPDAGAVAETHLRHQAKTGHKK